MERMESAQANSGFAVMKRPLVNFWAVLYLMLLIGGLGVTVLLSVLFGWLPEHTVSEPWLWVPRSLAGVALLMSAVPLMLLYQLLMDRRRRAVWWAVLILVGLTFGSNLFLGLPLLICWLSPANKQYYRTPQDAPCSKDPSPFQLTLGIPLVLVGALLPFLGLLYSALLPSIYESTALLEYAAVESGHAVVLSAEELTAEMQVLRSEAVQRQVIDQLDLRWRWRQHGGLLEWAEAETILRNSVWVEYTSDAAHLVKIRVRRDVPQEAAEMANRLAVAYAISDALQLRPGLEVVIVESALANPDPISPNVRLNVWVSIVGSATLMGAGYLCLRPRRTLQSARLKTSDCEWA